jgi:hypothetical protein
MTRLRALICRWGGHSWVRIPSGGGLAGRNGTLSCRRCRANGGDY